MTGGKRKKKSEATVSEWRKQDEGPRGGTGPQLMRWK